MKEKVNETKHAGMDDLIQLCKEDCSSPLYRTPVFLSFATDYNQSQKDFIERIKRELINEFLFPRTLGISEVSPEAPLVAIRRMVLSSFGMLCVGFRRVKLHQVVSRPGAEGERMYHEGWLSSPYLQIEPAMALQQGLPLLILVEDGIIIDEVFGGVFERGTTTQRIIPFNLERDSDFFSDLSWQSSFPSWVSDVRNYYNTMTNKVMY